ncbi:uncharacterized protein LOC144877296 [Branchiostoma floridae x Branchiostoma japonicum]
MGVLAVIFLGCAALLSASSSAGSIQKQEEVVDLLENSLRILEGAIDIEQELEQQQDVSEGSRNVMTRQNEYHKNKLTFPLRSPEGRYKFKSREEARRACEKEGAVLATYDNLFAAWQHTELSYCACGWLSDNTIRFPMRTERKGCGPAKVNYCPWLKSEADAWCYGFREAWRADGRCGGDYKAPSGRVARCDPDSEKPCCSKTKFECGSGSHCTCDGCIDYRKLAWRDDTRCGKKYKNKYGEPAGCNPDDLYHMCCADYNGYCGYTGDHCIFGVDYRKVVLGI